MLSSRQFQIYDNMIRQIYSDNDVEKIGACVLDHLSLLVPHDSAAFFMVKPGTHCFGKPLFSGLDDRHFKQYQEHYEDKDEYKKTVFSKRIIPPVDRSSDYMNYKEWSKNEHRADFLTPLRIHHLACMQVFYRKQLAGMISLHRSPGAPDFGYKEMNLLTLLHNHMNNVFENASLLHYGFNQQKLEEKIRWEDVEVYLFDKNYELTGSSLNGPGLLSRKLANGRSVYDFFKEICQGLAACRNAITDKPVHTSSGYLFLAGGRIDYKITSLAPGENRDRQEFLIITVESPVDYINSKKLSDAFGLTRRESEILSLIGRGKTNKEISNQLFVSENTVKTHIKRIFTKTGVTSRAELAFMLRLNGV